MSWCADLIKGQKKFSPRRKAPSPLNGCSCGVLPQYFLVFIIKFTWWVDVYNHIFFPKWDFIMWGCSVWKSTLTIEVPHMFWERAIIMCRAGRPRVGGDAFVLKGPGQMVAMAMAWHTSILVTQQPLCERRGAWWAPCGKLSPSHLEGWTMGNLNFCSWGMWILI